MIISTYLLSQFINLEGYDIERIAKVLNDIGIEVERVWKFQVSKRVVVGKVVAKSPHPNADKLSVCQVDIGYQTLQIVCGAKNVAQNQFVALALEGAKLPPKDETSAFFEIKQSNLRGVTSYGMICSLSELGCVKTNEGIMVLDSSVGELELGRELSDYAFFNQHFLEISLTPNRGDCMSVLGIARELASVFDSYVSLPKEKESALTLGVGRVLNITAKCNINSLLLYKVAKLKSVYPSVICEIILAYNGLLQKSTLENHKNFSTFMTGVLLDIYVLPKDMPLPAMLKVQKDENGFECVYDKDDNKLCVIGVKSYCNAQDIACEDISCLDMCVESTLAQEATRETTTSLESSNDYAQDLQDFSRNSTTTKANDSSDDSLLVVIQASFLSPHIIAQSLFSHKIPQDKSITHRSIRGANPQLLIGMNFFCEVLHSSADCLMYSGFQELEMQEAKNSITISASFSAISQAIGKSVPKEEIAQILKQLDFSIEANGEADMFRAIPPAYRHDIYTQQDITEEFLRVYGIANIKPMPYMGVELEHYTPVLESYLNKRDITKRALARGFVECLHYVFYQKRILQEWGYEVLDSTLELSNPITTELDTLRTSLIPALFATIVRNQNLGYKNIKLFEIGAVYDSKREQKEHFGIVASGLKRKESYPYPKGIKWDFYSFCEELSSIIGRFRLIPCENPPPNAHPYICADIFACNDDESSQNNEHRKQDIDGKGELSRSKKEQKIGIVAKLHPAFASKLGLQDSFFAEIFTIPNPHLQSAKSIAKLHSNERDITVLIDKNIPFYRIEQTILSANIPNLSTFYALDTYEDSAYALTIRLIFTPKDSSLTEEEIASRVHLVLETLESNFNAKLKI